MTKPHELHNEIVMRFVTQDLRRVFQTDDDPETAICILLETIVFRGLLATERYCGTPRRLTTEYLETIYNHVCERFGKIEHGTTIFPQQR